MGQYEYDHYHDGTGSPRWGPASGDYEDDRPSASDLYADEPHHMDDEEMERENLHESSEDPGFAEEETDDWPDPDTGHEDRNPDRPHPFGTPTYSPGGGYEDYDPSSAENLDRYEASIHQANEEPNEMDWGTGYGGPLEAGYFPQEYSEHNHLPKDPSIFGPAERWHHRPGPDEGRGKHEAPYWMAHQSPDPHKHERKESHRIGAILTQAEQWPFRVGYDKDSTPYHEFGHSGTGNLDEDEYMYNRDPEMGTTVPHMHGGDPKGAVTDARVMHPEETGLEYPVLARPNPKGDGFDVIKPLG